MPRFIIKIKDRYCEWSTVVDAPVSKLMPLDEFKEHIKYWDGMAGMQALPARLERVEAVGHSCRGTYTLEDIIACNHAGNDGEELTIDEIYEMYVGGDDGTDNDI